MAEQPDVFLTLGQAQERLGVSRVTVTALVRAGRLPVFLTDLDRRQRLVRESDVIKLTQPREVSPDVVYKQRSGE